MCSESMDVLPGGRSLFLEDQEAEMSSVAFWASVASSIGFSLIKFINQGN